LETKGYVKRTRSKDDERIVNINITQKGLKLKDEAVNVPAQMMDCLNLSQEESKTLYELLYKVIGK
jgi:DNA-binding MarR family transcriptional regulator